MGGIDRNAGMWGARSLGAVFLVASVATFAVGSGGLRWVALAILILSIACFVGGELQKRKMAAESRDSLPRLLVGNVLVKEWPLNPRLDVQGFTTGDTLTMASGIGMTGSTDERVRIHAVHLHVTNEPVNKRSKQKAEAVTLSIRYSRDGEEIMTRDGRWSGDSQLNPLEWTQRASEKTISPNFNPERFDVAIKYPEDDECFAMDDTVRFNPADWRKYPLGSGPLEVEVTARQSGEEPVVTRWLLSHDGPGSAPRLERLQ
jgi:hypothetical protein